MDHKTFISRLAERVGCTTEQATLLTDGLTGVLRDTGIDLDAAAIPGFGTFSTTKSDERVVDDPESGAHTLLPPSITMTFAPSVVLRKKISR
ncbi:MAG: HU family DNA-binding protein [Duncaniella sp.]|nr:HU family DNA-binding protein [Duncaniella sp.]